MSTASPCATQVYQLGGAQNVAFMHGLASDSCTWNRMTQKWLNKDFLLGTEIIPTFDWTQSLSAQGAELQSEINSAGGGGYILIGHSQGGLASRYAAQQYQSAKLLPAPVKGVVTLDSPNYGAPIVVTGPLALNAGLDQLAVDLWSWAGCLTPFDNFYCYIADVIYVTGPGFAAWWYSNGDIQDLTPGSPFLNNLDNYPETFLEAGIISKTPLRWNWSRILWNVLDGPGKECYPDSNCGERVVAESVGFLFDSSVAAEVFALLMEVYDPDNYDFWSELAQYFGGLISIMNTTNTFWNQIVSGDLPSDGIVPSSSQTYPSQNALQSSIKDADSHTGATTSTYVHTTLDEVLKGFPFNVGTQAGCSFSFSPASVSITGSGGNSSTGVLTAQGCNWSATSSQPWISITSGDSGTSSGSVSFSVGANPTTIPRTGTISVGNPSANAAFSVFQAGVCAYTLSADTVAIPSGGGSATVSVSTQPECVWSAVSNSTWISITGGASGTGPGSFTIVAEANAGETDLLGTVTVMNQILTVLVGSPTGTPSAGTVTINGVEREKVITYPCNLKLNPPCPPPTVIYESGSVTLTVGNDAYTVGYSGSSPTSSSVAAELAAVINEQSLVTASVSGSTITLTSRENGSQTNYCLSASYTFDTTDFGAPAFTSSVSGPSLTGGTN